MKIKHLQLNTTTQQYTKQIADFISDNDIHLAGLQEICHPTASKNRLAELLEARGYFYVEGIHFNFIPNGNSYGVALISKFPIIDVNRFYWNTDDYQPKNIKEEDLISTNIISDDHTKEHGFPASRAIRHNAKSRCILSALIDIEGKLLRLVTTHFQLSDLCTETSEIYDMALLTNSIIGNANDLPTIFSGDLNIRAKSYAVTKLAEIMTCHTKKLKSTLVPTHPAIINDYPQGLAIDHVFSKGVNHLGTEVVRDQLRIEHSKPDQADGGANRSEQPDNTDDYSQQLERAFDLSDLNCSQLDRSRQYLSHHFPVVSKFEV